MERLRHLLTICLHKGARQNVSEVAQVHHIPSPGASTDNEKGFESPVQGRRKLKPLADIVSCLLKYRGGMYLQ